MGFLLVLLVWYAVRCGLSTSLFWRACASRSLKATVEDREAVPLWAEVDAWAYAFVAHVDDAFLVRPAHDGSDQFP